MALTSRRRVFSLSNFEPNFNKLFDAKLSVLNRWCQIVCCENVWCQIILTSYYMVPNCPSANFSWCWNFPGTKSSSPQIGANLSAVKSRWCQIVLVKYCFDAKLFWCRIVWFQIVRVSNCLGAKLLCCPFVLVPNYMGSNCPGAKLSW